MNQSELSAITITLIVLNCMILTKERSSFDKGDGEQISEQIKMFMRKTK